MRSHALQLLSAQTHEPGAWPFGDLEARDVDADMLGKLRLPTKRTDPGFCRGCCVDCMGERPGTRSHGIAADGRHGQERENEGGSVRVEKQEVDGN